MTLFQEAFMNVFAISSTDRRDKMVKILKKYLLFQFSFEYELVYDL